MIFGSIPEWIFENDENDEGGGQLKIYFIFFSAIVIKIPGRGYPTLWGRVAPRGEPWTFFWAKIGFRIQWTWSQVLKVPGSGLIFGFLVFHFQFSTNYCR